MKTFLLFVAVLATAPGPPIPPAGEIKAKPKAAAVPTKIAEYASRCHQARQAELDEIRAKIKTAELVLSRVRNARIDRRRGDSGDAKTGPVTFANQESRARARDLAKAQLSSLQDELRRLEDSPPRAEMDRKLKVGLVGSLAGELARIRQVLGPQRMLVDISWGAPIRPESASPNVTLRSAAEYRAWVQATTLKGHDELVLVEGISTRGLVDDKPIELNDVFEVVGTETYQTVIGGSKTVFVIRPLDLAPYADLFRLPKTPSLAPRP
jgi:hypothetical protein